MPLMDRKFPILPSWPNMKENEIIACKKEESLGNYPLHGMIYLWQAAQAFLPVDPFTIPSLFRTSSSFPPPPFVYEVESAARKLDALMIDQKIIFRLGLIGIYSIQSKGKGFK